jgi:RNA 2',3'-cyclic 3'-phosphodiesterase
MRALAFDSFDWCLDRVGHFGGSRVVWVGGEQPALAALASQARTVLGSMQIAFDPKPFVAHVSLLRDVPGIGAARLAAAMPEAIQPIHWRVERAELLVSESDTRGRLHYCALGQS